MHLACPVHDDASLMLDVDLPPPMASPLQSPLASPLPLSAASSDVALDELERIEAEMDATSTAVDTASAPTSPLHVMPPARHATNAAPDSLLPSDTPELPQDRLLPRKKHCCCVLA